MRIGVATSLVVFSSEGNEIIGKAPILAARLQAEADPNSVLVAKSTFHLTRTKFQYSLLREVKLKGFDELISLWRPQGQIEPTSRGALSQDLKRPIRGREKELTALSRAWGAACEGNGSAIALVGEAGIGKSKLIREFADRLATTQHDAVVFQCNRRMESQPLHPFVAFLEGVVGHIAY